MKITIDYTERIFCVKIDEVKYFCNLNHIPEVLNQNIKAGQNFRISHLWNNKFEKLSKKELNGLFKFNDINFKIN